MMPDIYMHMYTIYSTYGGKLYKDEDRGGLEGCKTAVKNPVLAVEYIAAVYSLKRKYRNDSHNQSS